MLTKRITTSNSDLLYEIGFAFERTFYNEIYYHSDVHCQHKDDLDYRPLVQANQQDIGDYLLLRVNKY